MFKNPQVFYGQTLRDLITKEEKSSREKKETRKKIVKRKKKGRKGEGEGRSERGR